MSAPSLVLSAVVALSLIALTKGDFNLTFIHTNDAHAHYDPFNKYGTSCSASDTAAGKCFGGVARLKTVLDDIRSRYPNTILCDAGDQFMGSLFFGVHGYNITATFMNVLGYDVMAVGNHEFDKGSKNIANFSQAVNFPLISANVNHSAVSGVKISPTTVLTIAGHKVGFVGYTTTETAIFSSPGKITFSDEIEAVRREVKGLQAQNVSIIVALGHAGITKDVRIAQQVEGVDVIIGGHSNILLHNDAAPSIEKVYGQYPMVVTQSSGRKVLIVQAYMYVKYLGLLHVTFDDMGDVKDWSGNTIIVNSSYPEDQKIKDELAIWKVPIEQAWMTVIGQTHVLLDASKCRYAECNIGNMIAEALVERFNSNPPEGSWASVSIGIVNGGAIRSSMTPGDISLASLKEVQPFGNLVNLISMKGRDLMKVLQYCVQERIGHGGFLQFAGVRVEYEYNITMLNASRILSVHVRCAQCLVPTYSPLEDDQVYRIALSAFTMGGGDGYTQFAQYGFNVTLPGFLDSAVTEDYVRKRSPITQGLDGRIKTVNATRQETPKTTSTPLTMTCGCPPPTNTSLWCICFMLIFYFVQI